MSINRYLIYGGQVTFQADHLGCWVKHEDHVKEVERLQKIIDVQSVTINGLKPNKLGFYLVQRWYNRGSTPERDVKRFDELQGFLDYLAQDSAIENITVCAMQPIKVTRKQVLTVEM